MGFQGWWKSRLRQEARMTIRVLNERGAMGSEVARLLGVSEGAVRYHVKRMGSGAVDGRSGQTQKAAAYASAIEHWRQSADGAGLNLAALHAWLVREHGYAGSLRSVQRYWPRVYRRVIGSNIRRLCQGGSASHGRPLQLRLG